MNPLLPAHWWIVRGVVKDTGTTVTVPLYRLAPEGDADEGCEFLAADALGFARALQRAGNPGRLIYEPGAFHVHVAAWWAPETRRAVRHVRSLP